MGAIRGNITPLSYEGVRAPFPPNVNINTRPPTIDDRKNFVMGDLWLDKTTYNLYCLVSLANNIAIWQPLNVPWSTITSNQSASINNGYFCDKGSALLLALPVKSSVGDVIEIVNSNVAGGTQITQGSGQRIFLYGGTSTTLGASGTLTSTVVGDNIKLVCKVANTIWWQASGSTTWTPA